MIPCDRYHDELIAFALHAEVPGEEFVRHLDECVACGAQWKRLKLAGEIVASLPRRPAPPELEGRVVASLHAGQREDRAVRTMRGLTRLMTPDELSSAVSMAYGGEERAPALLERRLADDQADPGGTAARRACVRLRRIPAPPELARRLSADFQDQPADSRARLLPRGLIALAVAAGLLFVVQLSRGPIGPDAGPEPLLRFEIRTVESAAALDPWARAIFDDFTGGASQAVPQ